MRSDSSLDHVRIHLDTAVIEEDDKPGPMADRVAHGLGQIGDGRDAPDVVLQPGMQCFDDGTTSLLTNLSPMRGGLAADLGLDGVEFTDLRQYPGGERRLRRDMKVVEGTPHVCPTECQRH